MHLRNHLLAFSLLFTAVTFTNCTKHTDEDSGPVAQQKIDSKGGTVLLEDVIELSIPSGALQQSTYVTISKTAHQDTREDFGHAMPLFGVDQSIDYEVRVNTLEAFPAVPLKATLTIPEAIAAKLPEGSGWQVFGQLYSESEDEKLDEFEIISSRYTGASRTLEVEIPLEYFTNARTADKTYEAILTIASCPGPNFSKAKMTAGDCNGLFISCPLGSCNLVSARGAFGQRIHPITNQLTGHGGVDLIAAAGTDVHAASDGVVVASDYQYNEERGTGWGNYVVVEYTNENRQRYSTLYAHLSERGAARGTRVSEGDVIGQSGATGGATGPHLHFEYFVNGNIGDRSARVDPMPLLNSSLPRLYSAAAACTGINNCQNSAGTGSSWNVNFLYKDFLNKITPSATLTFQDVEPVTNPPYTVPVGAFSSNGGAVNSPVFCAFFGTSSYFKIKVFLTLPNGEQSNCIYFYLFRPGGANKMLYTEPSTTRIGSGGL